MVCYWKGRHEPIRIEIQKDAGEFVYAFLYSKDSYKAELIAG